jgi:pseudouridine-5'-phosphate glycosidase
MRHGVINRRLGAPVAAAALALGMTGCTGLFGEPNEVISGCPTTGVLRAAEQLDRYRPGSERDLTDLELRARIGNVRQVCSVVRDKRTLEMDLLLRVIAERGPAAINNQSQQLAYFVAVTDDQDTILSRETFPLALEFPNSARQASFDESLLVTVPIPPDKVIQDMRVFVGLQLTQDELNRALAQERGAR